MKQPTTQRGYAIFFKIGQYKKYVSGSIIIQGNRHQPRFSNSIDEAKPFPNYADAISFIRKIHNPYERVYETEPHLFSKKAFTTKDTEEKEDAIE